jgi:hypothetical protein
VWSGICMQGSSYSSSENPQEVHHDWEHVV